jgi:hypothetical protein
MKTNSMGARAHDVPRGLIVFLIAVGGLSLTVAIGAVVRGSNAEMAATPAFAGAALLALAAKSLLRRPTPGLTGRAALKVQGPAFKGASVVALVAAVAWIVAASVNLA